MNFDYTVEQKMLQQSARSFFSKEVDSNLVRELEADRSGHSSKLWHKMARLGWQGILIPEQYGGAGMTFSDMNILLKEMGHVAFSGPFFTSALFSSLILLEAGSEIQKDRYLPELAEGKTVFTCAWMENNSGIASADIATTALLRDNHYVISGMKQFVPYAHVADYFIVAARAQDKTESGEGGVGLFIVDSKAQGVDIDLIDTSAGEKYCEVAFDRVQAGKENLLGELHQGWPVLRAVIQRAAVAKCAEMVGGGEKILKMTVDYAKERRQFDRPIGSFQAVQHHCADMKTWLDTSAMMLHQAGWRIDADLPWEKEAAMCKAYVSEALRELFATGHQIMGGFGFMEEADHHLYTRRAKAGELMFGTADQYRELVAEKMGL